MSQQLPPTFGVPGLRHFWDPRTAAAFHIRTLRNRGTDYTLEDVVWHTWQAICQLYFPEATNDPNGPVWTTIREAYRGPATNPSAHRPDVLTIKLMFNEQLGDFVTRDVLWVECKAPDNDNPYGWKEVLRETVVRLDSAHPDRELFILIAIGIKWMYFSWDPINASRPMPQLFIQPHSRRQAPWIVDPRVKPLHDAPWVDTETGQVSPSNAMTLDFWSTTNVGQEARVVNWQALELLEEFLQVVRSSILTGVNPAHF